LVREIPTFTISSLNEFTCKWIIDRNLTYSITISWSFKDKVKNKRGEESGEEKN